MTIYFNEKRVTCREGDSVASALYRAGHRIFSRSFKFHRPRGLLCLRGKCPNCLVNVDGIPNVRSCVTPARDGMRVAAQNAWPSLGFDALSMIVPAFKRLMPVGWYYKTFTKPWAWHAAEPFIRRAAGLGTPPREILASTAYEHTYMHAQVAVIGAGPAGVEAAKRAADKGQQVVLVDDGGAGVSAATEVGDRAIEVIQPASCFGLYEGGLLGVLQATPRDGVRERLIHLRAQRIVIATGAYEVPVLFTNNDLPGIMLSTAVERLIHRHGIVPGRRAVLVGAAPRTAEIASTLESKGVEIAATLAAAKVERAVGSRGVHGVIAGGRTIPCDLVVMCGPLVPDVGLITQAGGRIDWDSGRGAFVPTQLPAFVEAVGAASGAGLVSAAEDRRVPGDAIVCLCSDVAAKDLRDGIAEGFDQIETLKRYTTFSMGPCQGRMCQLSAIGICSQETGRDMRAVGATTFRPPNPGVSLGALSGPRRHIERRTPLHHEHNKLRAVWLDMGEWKRPAYYPGAASSEAACVAEEYEAVRKRAGLIDVSTLGKLDVKGRDAGRLLDQIYISGFSDLKVDRTRYAAMCDETGILTDDGTVTRLSETDWFITTTTGNLDFVQQSMEWWLAQSDWHAFVTNVTAGYASMNLAGPNARDVLSKITDCDLSSAAFPYMSARRATLAGIPAILLRIGFVGETGWEIHVPAESGPRLWNELLMAGAPQGIRAFGVETQRLLRLEKAHAIVGVDTDALTRPADAGLRRLVRVEKPDFAGRAALRRQDEPSQLLAGFIMQEDVTPQPGAAVMVNGQLGGRVTSAKFSPGLGKAIGLAWIPATSGDEGAQIHVRVDGRPAVASVTRKAFYDPEGARLRM